MGMGAGANERSAHYGTGFACGCEPTRLTEARFGAAGRESVGMASVTVVVEQW